MKTITFEQANANLKDMIKHSLETHEEISIMTNQGAVIIIPEEDYEAMQETLRLLNDKKSLNALLKGQKQRESGRKPKSYSVEEIFSDL